MKLVLIHPSNPASLCIIRNGKRCCRRNKSDAERTEYLADVVMPRSNTKIYEVESFEIVKTIDPSNCFVVSISKVHLAIWVPRMLKYDHKWNRCRMRGIVQP